MLARPEDDERVRKALLERFESATPSFDAEPAVGSAELSNAERGLVAGLRGHAVLLGHGRVGGVLAGMLRRAGQPFVIVEQDALIVQRLRRQGMLALAGRADSSEVLDEARVASARLLLVTCGGEFDRRTGHYERNVVVFAVPA